MGVRDNSLYEDLSAHEDVLYIFFRQYLVHCYQRLGLEIDLHRNDLFVKSQSVKIFSMRWNE